MADLLKTARKLLCILSTVMFLLIVINIAFLRHDSVSLHGLQYLNRRTTNISNKALMILSSAEFKETSGNKTLEPETNRPHAVQYHGIDLMSLVSTNTSANMKRYNEPLLQRQLLSPKRCL